MILRPATPADLQDLHNLHHASWASAYRGMVPDGALGAPLDDHMGRVWAELPGGITVAHDGTRLMGFVRLKPNQGWPYIDNLHVAPDLRGHGIGESLLKAAATQAEQGRMWLTVLAVNHGARRFYRRMGGQEGAQMTEILLDTSVATYPVIWGHLAPLIRGAE
ncbi:GNAT family N-acetyltransferase [Oceaniglobus ichthyenteri]|uniref:GNAT family N-acetyltransferase n=1 Tax=Oceaniglobus ichthyenteri TaxID=2136177 RepID=UPI000D3C4B3F|nr:GNAT family N-acetyltransferase [Oceaniglobus ichthyenteri]